MEPFTKGFMFGLVVGFPIAIFLLDFYYKRAGKIAMDEIRRQYRRALLLTGVKGGKRVD